MRIVIPHTLGKAEVRRRIDAKIGAAGDKASEMLGAMASVNMEWADADHLRMDVSAMGFDVPCTLEVADSELVLEVQVPAGLGFARGMIENVIREKGEKLLR